jgi:regulatory protein
VADAADRAYVDGLKMLARRELSEKQVRERLARRGHDEAAVAAAVDRLRTERAIDDSRVAAAIARTETGLRRRGRLRVRRRIESAGIAASIAGRTVDELFQEVDSAVLLQASLARRLRGERPIADDGEFRRLYRYLVGQGFEPDQVLRALRARSVK